MPHIPQLFPLKKVNDWFWHISRSRLAPSVVIRDVYVGVMYEHEAHMGTDRVYLVRRVVDSMGAFKFKINR